MFRGMGLVVLLFTAACGTNSQLPTGSHTVLERAAAAVVSIGDGSSTLASGFFVSADLLVTNAHVLAKQPLYIVLEGKRHALQVVRSDEALDLAVLTSPNFTAAGLLRFRAGAPVVGERVYALGSPFGLGITATEGIVSALPRAIGKSHLLQTDAAINPGNSGGPLIDAQGQALGIVTSRGAVGSGIGFAVPGAEVERFVRVSGNLKAD